MERNGKFHAGKTPGRRQVLILAPSVPSPQASRRERAAYKAFTLACSGHDVLCLPEDKPLSAKLDEASLASRGVGIYAFHKVTPLEVSKQLKTLITANPGLEIIGFAGLGTLRRHLVDARLFAPSKSFFAVLDREDVTALRGEDGEAESGRRLLSCCDAVFCEDASGARLLRRLFHARAHELPAIPGVLASLTAAGARQEKFGLITPARGGAVPAPKGAVKPARRAAAWKDPPDHAALNRLILGASRDITAWAVVTRPFTACGALWPRLNAVLGAFPDAGLVLPSQAVLKDAAGTPPPAMLLEAASLNSQGAHSEPLLVEDLPLLLLRSEAFRGVGGFDTRFSSPACAWTDLGLRMGQAGFRVITAEDAVVSCRRPAAKAAGTDTDLLVHKWCADGLRIMELLLLELGGRQP